MAVKLLNIGFLANVGGLVLMLEYASSRFERHR